MAAVPCATADPSISAKDLIYITEQYPPYNYQEDGKLQGLSVDILERAWERMGANLNRSSIQLLPWTEGYDRALNENNTVLFSTARLPQREQLFRWAGPIASGRYVLLAKAEKNVSIADINDLGRYKIGAVEDDMAIQLLMDRGLKKDDLVLEGTSKPIIEMLENGSIDAWAYNDITGIWQIQESGKNASNYEAVYVLGTADAYLAFNREVPDSLVQSFQEAIDYIKGSKDENVTSDYDRILADYIPEPFIAGMEEQNEVMDLLDEAVAYLLVNGEEKALLEFNNRSGPFVRGDLYVFAYDFNGTCIAHPINPDLIGRTGLSDVNNADVVGRELALARRGGGTMYIVFPNPAHGGKEELKQLYIENVNDSLYLGSGLYLSGVSASFDEAEISELVSFVEEALRFARENGRQKSLEAFNDPAGNFTRDGRYIFAYDYEGRTLALPYQPELIGTSRIDARDPNGVYFIQQAIDVAQMGDGFLYYVYPDSSRNMTPALKLSYVANVDGTWLLGSGIYAEGTDFGPKTTSGEPLWRLISACDAVSANLSQMEMALEDAGLALSETGIDGPAARAVLSNLTMADAAVIDCITIDANGTVREVEPSSFGGIRGENLKWQTHVNDTLNTGHYSGFHFIRAVEGLYAIDSEMPVFDRNGTLIGTVSLMFNNSRFFGRVLAPFQPGGNSKIWVSKADDATILYETDPSQMLLNKSSDAYREYPELLELADRMSAERIGYGTYEFLDQSHGEAVKKGCYWITIPSRGTEMRIVLTLQLN